MKISNHIKKKYVYVHIFNIGYLLTTHLSPLSTLTLSLILPSTIMLINLYTGPQGSIPVSNYDTNIPYSPEGGGKMSEAALTFVLSICLASISINNILFFDIDGLILLYY